VVGDVPREINDRDRENLSGLLAFATHQADQLELQAVHDRVDQFKIKLRNPIRLHDFLAEVRTLRERSTTELTSNIFIGIRKIARLSC
jgi:hypothetical protein